jgi:hypothetical protein
MGGLTHVVFYRKGEAKPPLLFLLTTIVEPITGFDRRLAPESVVAFDRITQIVSRKDLG